MTNKEICLKYQEIEDKAVEITKKKGKFDWYQNSVFIHENGLIVAFYLENNYDNNTFLITWEDLNDKN